MNLQENIQRIRQMMGTNDYEMIPTDLLRRPNGHIGTQGFTSESLFSLLKHISNVKNFELPKHESLKELINKLKDSPETVDMIIDYIKLDPIEIRKLPDDTYVIKDGNHRANLLNLLGVDKLPIKNL
jgi:hypothetical protein